MKKQLAVFQEKELGVLPKNILWNTYTYDAHGWALGFVVKGDWGQKVWVNGQEGPAYDGIGEGSPIFSPDGKRVAYAAQKGEKRVVVVDGQEGPEYDIIIQNGPSFHPDGTLEFLAVKADILYRVLVQ